MEDPIKKARRMIRFWQKRLEALTVNVNAVNAKEKTEGKEETPPAPPLGEREGEKKKELHTLRARACEVKVPPVIDVHTPPTLELLLAWAKSRGKTDEAFIRKWHDTMTHEYFWRHPKTGDPLNHWVAYFNACYRDRNRDAAGGTRSAAPRKADNWRGTKSENIESVF